MCFQIFFSIKVMLKPSENVMNSHFYGGTTEQFWVKDVSFYLIFLCIFWQFFEFCFAQNFKLSVNYLKNSFPCSKNYLICLNFSLNTPYFTSVFPSQWSLNLMARILLVIVLLCPPPRVTMYLPDNRVNGVLCFHKSMLTRVVQGWF